MLKMEVALEVRSLLVRWCLSNMITATDTDQLFSDDEGKEGCWEIPECLNLCYTCLGCACFALTILGQRRTSFVRVVTID